MSTSTAFEGVGKEEPRTFIVTDEYRATRYVVTVQCDNRLQGNWIALDYVAKVSGVPRSRLSTEWPTALAGQVLALDVENGGHVPVRCIDVTTKPEKE